MKVRVPWDTNARRRRAATPRHLLLLALVALTLPIEARAQETVARVDLTGARVRYADSLSLTTVSLSPEFAAEWPLAVVRAVGSYAQLSGGGSSIQGTGGFSLFTPAAGILLGELEAFGGGSRVTGVSTSQVLGILRGHMATATNGAWVGAGFGTASDGTSRRATQLAEVGAWASYGPARTSLSVIPTRVEDTIRYTDVNLAGRAELTRVELLAIVGFRSGAANQLFGSSARIWANASVTKWITSRVALVAGAGRYPVDLTQGFPGGAFGSVGLRMATRLNRSSNDRPATTEDPVPTASDEAPIGHLQLSTAGGMRRQLYVRVPAARVVELAGDFTAWQPVQLTSRPEGWWSIELELDPGTYETALRVDGGEWIAPPGLIRLRDEFGGEGGILVVP